MPFWINIIVSSIAFVITAISGFFLIPYLRKVKFGQTILDIGPNWHKSKQGTPIMGGFMFVLGSVVATIIGYVFLRTYNYGELLADKNGTGIKLLVGIVMALLFMGVGFMDDYIKAVKKQNLGLKAKQKLVFQIMIAVGYLYTLYILGETSTYVFFPFIGAIDFGIFYYPLMVMFIIFMVNSVNLTDGVDGLCSSVTLIALRNNFV